MREHGGEGRFVPAKSLAEFVDELRTPRIVLVMVKAGKPVDDMIDELLPPICSPDDILIDGGNSPFHGYPPIRRGKLCEAKGIRLVGMGVSGGEEGALRVPA